MPIHPAQPGAEIFVLGHDHAAIAPCNLQDRIVAGIGAQRGGVNCVVTMLGERTRQSRRQIGVDQEAH
jgi:hypothetical protein